MQNELHLMQQQRKTPQQQHNNPSYVVVGILFIKYLIIIIIELQILSNVYKKNVTASRGRVIALGYN